MYKQITHMVRGAHIYIGTYHIYEPNIYNNICTSVQFNTPINYITATNNGQLANDIFSLKFRMVHLHYIHRLQWVISCPTMNIKNKTKIPSGSCHITYTFIAMFQIQV